MLKLSKTATRRLNSTVKAAQDRIAQNGSDFYLAEMVRAWDEVRNLPADATDIQIGAAVGHANYRTELAGFSRRTIGINIFIA